MTDLPSAPFERILKKSGAARVSRGAIDEFAMVLDGVALELASEAVTMAKHAGRKTVTDSDIKLARKKLE